MGEIQIIQKPEMVSYDDIHELIYLAHDSNRKKGFHVKTAEMSGKELENHIGDGICFVAMDNDRLIGVTAVRVISRNTRFAKGKIADQILVAIHPDYTGKHISSNLHKAVVRYSEKKGLAQIELRTAADNLKMQKACIKWGFRYVDFKAYSGIDHYTVVMMKWLVNRPSPLKINCYYTIKKIFVKTRYKAGRVKRFGK